jgi:argininosuccinate lyase
LSDASILVPVIKDFMEVSIKNDEHLVKLAAVIQRSLGAKGEESTTFLTDEEKEALLKGIEEIQKEVEETKQNESTKDDNKW